MLLSERSQELQSLNGFLPVVALNKTHSFTQSLLGSVWKLSQLETVLQLCNSGHSDGSQRLFLVVEGNDFSPGAEVAGVARHAEAGTLQASDVIEVSLGAGAGPGGGFRVGLTHCLQPDRLGDAANLLVWH